MDQFPKCKYSATEPPRIVKNDLEEKALGDTWFDHPEDAKAGRVLNHIERGGGEPAKQHAAEQSAKAKEKAEEEDEPESKSKTKSAHR